MELALEQERVSSTRSKKMDDFSKWRANQVATPTPKHPSINKFLDELSGDSRVEAITGNRCLKPPIGCGGPAIEFSDAISSREYTISGLCQKCQDKIFNSPEEN